MNKLLSRNTLNWILGLVISAFGLCLCTKSDLGLSMIGAGPYILHVWLRSSFAWFTQGTAEYVWEAVLLVATCLVLRGFRPRYLLSFCTAVLVGFIIDGWFLVLGGNGPYATLASRVIAFAAGTVITALGVAFFFRTTLPLEVYELTVVELAEKYGLDKNRVKQVFDFTMLGVAVALTLITTHSLTGVGWGTLIVTIVNAPLIAMFGRLIDRLEAIQTQA